MKLKTEQEIKQQADIAAEEWHPCIKEIDPDKYFVITEAFYEGAEWMQQDLQASASEGYSIEEMRHAYDFSGGNFHGMNNEVLHKHLIKTGDRLWQAAKLSSAKEIKELKKENEELKLTAKKINDDYWFIINLIERYSTNKDEALKDILERLKFRKPLLEKWFKGTPGE